MDDKLLKWIVPGKYEIFAWNRSYLIFESEIKIDVFETDRSVDVKGDHLAGYHKIQLPVPRCNMVQSNNHTLEQQIKKGINTICELRENTVAVKLDSIFTWPLEDFVTIFLSCLKKFAAVNSDWKFLRVTFCTNDRKQFEVISKICNDLFTSAKESKLTGATSSPLRSPASVMTAMAAIPLKVVVEEGSLENATIDVIACTMGSDLELNSGGASKALNRACNRKLQKEVDQQSHRMQLQDGEVAVLDMNAIGGLKCKHVFFGTLTYRTHKHRNTCSFQKNLDQLDIHEFMMRCFEKADSLGHTSIAFPAIGTGNKGYPVDIVARQMFESASLFQPKYGLKNVIFVVYDKHVVQAFKKEESILRSSMTSIRQSQSTTEVPKLKQQSFMTQSKFNTGGTFNLSQTYVNVKETFVDTISEENWEKFQYFYKDDVPAVCRFDRKGENLVVTCTEQNNSLAKETWYMIKKKISNLKTVFMVMSEEDNKTFRSQVQDICNKHHAKSVYKNELLYIIGEDTAVLLIAKSDIEHLLSQTQHNFTSTNGALSFRSSHDQRLSGARPKDQYAAQQTQVPTEASLREFRTKEGIRVCVYCCDIMKTRVDCIVNAANQNLDHQAGIANAIASKAGISLVEEGNKLLKNKPQQCLEVGEACHTTAGNLLYKCVIHAVGPEWLNYKPHTKEMVEKCEKKLQSAILNSLIEAEKLGMKSVAIPSISSGVFFVPKPICAVSYARAVQDYSKLSQKPLLEVHFVDLDDNMVKLVQDAFREVLTVQSLPSWYNIKDILGRIAVMTGMSTQRKAEDPTHSPKTYLSHTSKPGGSGTKPSGLPHNTGKSPHQRAPTDTSFCFEEEIDGTSTRSLTFHFSPTQVLHVYSEDLLGTTMPKVDMLVCSDNLKATEKGYLVGTLRSTAGKKYTDEKDKAFKKTGVKHGEVIVCNGGATRYKYIAVVVMHFFSTPVSKSEKKMKYLALYRNIFKTAVEKRIGSVALSALGTGSGTMNPEDSIENFAEGLLEFFKQNKTQKLCVHFVNKKTEINKLAKYLIQQTWKMRPEQHVNIEAPGHAISSDARSEINENSVLQVQMSKPQMKKKSNDSSPTNNFKKNVDGRHINQRNTSNLARSMSIPPTVPAEHKTEFANPKRFSASLMDRPGDFNRSMLASQIPKGHVGGYLQVFEIDDNQAANGNDMQPTDPVLNKIDRRETTPPHISSSGGDMHSLGMEQSKEHMPGPDDNCVICMDKLKNPKMLNCGHAFCSDCIKQQFVYKEACPACGTVYGVIKGDQPDGTMEVWTNETEHCAGFDRCGRIEITYNFRNGTQNSSHPNPSKPYKGIRRTAYLPNNSRGRKIAEMLRVAFERKLVFTIGSSRTTGKEDVITWNDIHHKTDHKPNTQFGYPDDTYLDRVTDELKVKGITEDDIPQISSKRR